MAGTSRGVRSLCFAVAYCGLNIAFNFTTRAAEVTAHIAAGLLIQSEMRLYLGPSITP
jgi:hypothetical protein